MKTIHILLLSFTLFLFSCVKEATIKLPPQQNKLVVTCFISPDDTLIVATVRASIPKYGTASISGSSGLEYGEVIHDATVVLSDDAGSVTLPFDNILQNYVIPPHIFPIVAGKTYSLSVSTPDGQLATASTTVPRDILTIKSVDGYTYTQGNGNVSVTESNEVDYELNIAVNDLPDQTNYVEFYFQDKTVYHYSDTLVQPEIKDSTFEEAGTYFDSDESNPRAVYSYNYKDGFYSKGLIEHAQVNIAVLNCSHEFYMYNQSVKKALDANDNPFSEPVFVYTNMSSGFGCFGSYLGTYQSKQFK